MKIKIDRQKNNPLIQSYYDNDIDKFRKLIKSGANVNCVNNTGCSLIELVITHDCLSESCEFFDVLMENKVYLCKIGDAQNLLYLAMMHKRRDYFNKMLDSGIDINWYKPLSYNGLSYNPIIFDAVSFGKDYYINLLLDKGVDISGTTNFGDPILVHHITCCKTKFTKKIGSELLLRFIDSGADLNERGYNDMSPMHCTIFNGLNHLLEILLDNSVGLELNIRDSKGNTALIYATIHNNPCAVKMLIDKGAILNISNVHNETSLILSVKNNKFEIFNLLLENSSCISSVDKNGCNILHYMIEYDKWIWKDEEIQKYYVKIIEKYPDLMFVKNKKGETPMDLLYSNQKNNRMKKVFINSMKNINNSKLSTKEAMSL